MTLIAETLLYEFESLANIIMLIIVIIVDDCYNILSLLKYYWFTFKDMRPSNIRSRFTHTLYTTWDEILLFSIMLSFCVCIIVICFDVLWRVVWSYIYIYIVLDSKANLYSRYNMVIYIFRERWKCSIYIVVIRLRFRSRYSCIILCI